MENIYISEFGLYTDGPLKLLFPFLKYIYFEFGSQVWPIPFVIM